MPGTQGEDEATRETTALRIGAGLDAVTVSGLTGDERAEVIESWARCGVEAVEPPARADAHRDADPARPWLQWHEDLVFLATSQAIESARGTHLMFHAACLAAPDTGEAIVLVAASGTGKTTATRRLGPHFDYLTDETAIIAPDGLAVTPYPKPLSVLEARGVRPKTQRGPDDLGLGPTLPDARLARIAVLDRVRDPAGPVAPRAEAMELVAALKELVPQTSSLSLLPRGLVTLCRVLDALGGAQRLVYAEAEDLRDVVDGLLATPPTPVTPTWEALTVQELSASGGAAAPGAVSRCAVDDGILTDHGRLVLLASDRLVVLEGLGPSVWLLLDEPRTAADVVACLRTEGPVPEDAEARVQEAMDALIAVQLATAG
ncbi:PqqD family peptide modification chaperone [Micrococcus sp. Mcc89]|uniref:PqqD family peptide modification chaperone n=1 Tax=Micrococcus sp. Mcc89 TaxID=2926014 RepID=UPI0021176E2C|nr:PqqD family peptide modification chaperone [Micrococcus sp. Mcc89]